ncbi:hypothetical protein ABFS83_14G206600 [Erythranthe nasuta]
MGCFLGCLGGAKDQKRRRQQRTHRGGSPRVQRNRVQNVQQETVASAEPTVAEIPQTNLVSDLQSKPTGEVQLSPSPRKRVTFNSNVTTYEHVSVQDSIDSLPHPNGDVDRESEDENSVLTKNVVSYPPNHRYHNARESDDEAEEYGDSDLDDFDDSDDEYDYDDDDMISDEEVWNESVSTTSVEKVNAVFESKDSARDRRGYVNSVLNPIENIAQWKAAKSKVKPQEKFAAQKKENQEIAVDASLSWLVVSPEIGGLDDDKLTSSSSGKNFPEGSSTTTRLRSFQDRPIETAGTHWNHSASTMRYNSAPFYKREVFMK